MATNGTTGNDLLNGTAGSDTIRAKAGNDTLNGLASFDYLYGDDGNDVINGGGGNDKLYGGAGNDIADGGDGNDTVDADNGDDVLTGGLGDDSLIGDLGSDTVDGGAGNDVLYYSSGVDRIDGGAGTDTLSVSINASDTTNISLNSALLATNTGQTLSSGANFRNIERLTYIKTGAGNDALTIGPNDLSKEADLRWYAGGGYDRLILDFAMDTDGIRIYSVTVSGTPTAVYVENLANGTQAYFAEMEAIIVSGGVNDDHLMGLAGADSLNGGRGHDSLNGGDGDDKLDGGSSLDTMVGGKGNDTYYVDNAGDEASDLAGQGTDLVYSTVSFSLVDTAVEDITLTGTADIDATGNALVNILIGNDGANRLYGNGGADIMAAGFGNDTYYVDNSGDDVRELSNRGNDTVYTSANFSAASTAVETLIMAGTGHLSVTGNNLANTITGNAGNNLIDGGGGIDSMTGGLGNDTYVISDTADIVVELAGQGTDTVQAVHSFALSVNVENLTLIGTGNTAGVGNGLDNVIIGNSGSNRLTGNGGADTFVFLGGSGVDRIWDFSAAQNDRIDISDYTHGVVNGGGVTITQSFANTLIDLGDGNVITVARTQANDAAFLSDIIW